MRDVHRKKIEDERKKIDALPNDPKLLKKLLLESWAQRDVYQMVAALLKDRREPNGIGGEALTKLSNRDKTRIAALLHERFHYRLTLRRDPAPG